MRAYQGTKKVGKQYSTRLKFPVSATMETWVADANGVPVFMVMAESSTSLIGELRRLVPMLRTMVGDGHRVMIGFDREGWSPKLFHELIAAGFDPLAWRKGKITDLNEKQFAQQVFTTQFGSKHSYDQVADTYVELSYGTGSKETRFSMWQVSRIVAAGKQVREASGGKTATRQIHLLTGNTNLPAAQLLHLLSARWRHENYFRYTSQHFALNAHDTYRGKARIWNAARRTRPRSRPRRHGMRSPAGRTRWPG